MDVEAEELHARLESRYREPHRRYHDLRHLREVLAAVDVLAEHADDVEAVRWAAWYHDAVYDVHRDDNEEQSARLAERELAAAGLDAATVAEVVRLVRLTATHDPRDGDRNGAVLSDADLAVLAAGADRYAQYRADVRAEYAHVPDPLFRAGRAAVLRALRAADPLYRTGTARGRWERRARTNLDAELAALDPAPDAPG